MTIVWRTTKIKVVMTMVLIRVVMTTMLALAPLRDET